MEKLYPSPLYTREKNVNPKNIFLIDTTAVVSKTSNAFNRCFGCKVSFKQGLILNPFPVAHLAGNDLKKRMSFWLLYPYKLFVALRGSLF